jgi:hypothetical protein
MVSWHLEGGGEVSGRERRESYAKDAKGIPKNISEDVSILFEFGINLSG